MKTIIDLITHKMSRNLDGSTTVNLDYDKFKQLLALLGGEPQPKKPVGRPRLESEERKRKKAERRRAYYINVQKPRREEEKRLNANVRYMRAKGVDI